MVNYIGMSNTGGHNIGPYRGALKTAHGNSANQPNLANQGAAAFAAYTQLQANALAQQAAGTFGAGQIIPINQISGGRWSSIAPMGVLANGNPAPTYPKLKLPHSMTAGEIISWRAWRINNGWLTSVYMDTFWAPHETMEGNPETDGVHAWKKMADAIEYSVHLAFKPDIKIIIGTVALWGEVIEHKIGYRAQFAKIKSLDHGANDSVTKEELQELRRKYLA